MGRAHVRRIRSVPAAPAARHRQLARRGCYERRGAVLHHIYNEWMTTQAHGTSSSWRPGRKTMRRCSTMPSSRVAARIEARRRTIADLARQLADCPITRRCQSEYGAGRAGPAAGITSPSLKGRRRRLALRGDRLGLVLDCGTSAVPMGAASPDGDRASSRSTARATSRRLVSVRTRRGTRATPETEERHATD